MSDRLLAELNEDQREAVRICDRPLLVLAGAGSGKTRVITFKVAHLIDHEGLRPDSILGLTFTNRAAREMRTRAEALLAGDAERVTLGTFHAVGLRILRRHAELIDRDRGMTVYDAQDQETLAKRILRELDVADDQLRPAAALHWIQRQKENNLGPLEPREIEVLRDRRAKTLALVYREYETRLRAANAVDFGDLIALPTELFVRYPEILAGFRYQWRHVLVDEFQDTNVAQYRFLRALTGPGDGEPAGITAVGDDDQAIYSWRGATVENILGFKDDYEGAHVVRLERNYRSTGNILKAASGLISHNSRRHEKTLWTEAVGGAPLEISGVDSEFEEADRVVRAIQTAGPMVSYDDIAVFYRTNAQSRVLEDALRRRGIPYRVYGGMRFYDRAEVKDVLAYLRVLANPADDVSLQRILNVPARGIGAKTASRLAELARARGLTLRAALGPSAAAFGGAAGRRLAEFATLLDELTVKAREAPVLEVLEDTLERTGYLRMYDDAGTVEAETRGDNVRELVSAVAAFADGYPQAKLGDLLDEIALATDLDETEAGAPVVTLMTVHSAKGLEFDHVFIVGLEKGLMPHVNAASNDEVEEERRLAYVAITRARQRVFLSYARTRRRYGAVEVRLPSPFLRELPPDLLAPRDTRTREEIMGRPASRRPIRRTPQQPNDSAYPQDFALTLDQAIGRTVRHPVFGVGVISGGYADRVHVEFETAGRKTLPAAYLRLVDD